MREIFLQQCIRKLRQWHERVEECVDRLNHEQIWWRGAEAQNAIGNLMLHLKGNVGQWILSGVGGYPDVRQRDAEFSERQGLSAAELKSGLRDTVDRAVEVIGGVSDQRLVELTRIQNYEVPVLEAISHSVQHFGEHTGQIIYATKLMTNQGFDWYSHLQKAAHGQKTP